MFGPKSRILVVDDMSMMRKVVVKFCNAFGLTEVTEAKDGAEAWQKISEAEAPFDLVISDWTMPNCTGIDLLKRIRADSRFGKTPVLMVTAEKEKHLVMEAMKAGVSGYVVKPFTQDTLKEKMEAIYAKVG